tara:strand:- start:423 stop:671 length:249 start_codon:yes stop_codon:yes gene_type:complete
MEHHPTMPLPPPGSLQRALMQVPHAPAERRCDGHTRAPSLVVHAAQQFLLHQRAEARRVNREARPYEPLVLVVAAAAHEAPA